MSESPAPTVPAPPPPPAKPNRLYQAAAWVVIVAGTVFVGAVIFCTGAYLSDGGGRGNPHGPCMMHGGPSPMAPDSGPGWPGFRPAGPGNGPGGPGGPPPSPPHR
ncbi:hypothetical protein KV112_20300 [Mycolicibacter sp. MYC123]|uniref:Proline rich protein n=1 Tax=[Mycobacterium] zoologicum TaxID=2872311 RepID=A0ABU5YPQ9_9MYCO|nr:MULTISPECIES: hypothetical protein [unclassified Mycolicibacter]MEB3052055.1 hypothetical protein [Mycolicibacter sp. MYC123]MEB3064464.1 hypothetical protein [Mycolicibacter sp. MYC101]